METLFEFAAGDVAAVDTCRGAADGVADGTAGGEAKGAATGGLGRAYSWVTVCAEIIVSDGPSTSRMVF